MQAFKVHDVDVNTSEFKIQPGFSTAQACVKKLLKKTAEAAACDSSVVLTTPFNPLVAAIDMAFREHRPLVLRPDDIWLCVAQGLSQHINLHAEGLRKRLVTWDGKKKLKVVRNGFVKGSPDNDWLGVFEEFRALIAKEVPVVHDRMSMQFSTTTPFDFAAMDLALMDAMSSYFEYGMSTMCGIPSVRLEGHAADWEELYNRIATVRLWWREEIAKGDEELSLEWWLGDKQLFRTARMLCVTAEYIENHGLELHAELQQFWDNIYKEQKMSGGPYVTGWVNTLFPYLVGGNDKADLKNFALEETKKSFGGGPKLNMYPVGFSTAPLVWNYHGTEINMLLAAGFGGIAQDTDTATVRAARVWAVCEEE